MTTRRGSDHGLSAIFRHFLFIPNYITAYKWMDLNNGKEDFVSGAYTEPAGGDGSVLSVYRHLPDMDAHPIAEGEPASKVLLAWRSRWEEGDPWASKDG